MSAVQTPAVRLAALIERDRVLHEAMAAVVAADVAYRGERLELADDSAALRRRGAQRLARAAAVRAALDAGVDVPRMMELLGCSRARVAQIARAAA